MQHRSCEVRCAALRYVCVAGTSHPSMPGAVATKTEKETEWAPNSKFVRTLERSVVLLCRARYESTGGWGGMHQG